MQALTDVEAASPLTGRPYDLRPRPAAGGMSVAG
jgi:hypothetical protein